MGHLFLLLFVLFSFTLLGLLNAFVDILVEFMGNAELVGFFFADGVVFLTFVLLLFGLHFELLRLFL